MACGRFATCEPKAGLLTRKDNLLKIARRFIFAVFLIAGWQTAADAQGGGDSALVFQHRSTTAETEKTLPRLSGIGSISAGSFSSFKSDNTYGSFLQPNLGFDFLAEPGGAIHLLLGGRLGFSSPMTNEILFGFRQPIFTSDDRSRQIFGDLTLLFFGDHSNTGAVNTGVRVAFGGKFEGDIDPVIALVGEFRGSRSTSEDFNRARTLWWVGLEAGISFPIVSDYTAPTHKDSIRASLKYIASGEEIDELDQLTSNGRIDEWLYRFWKRRDMTPGTPLNEARDEFERRAAEANNRFSSSRHLGVQTDIGRVFLLYGNPDVIESTRGSANESRGYVLWVYQRRIQSQGLAVFIFRVGGLYNYQQVYSNVPGELTGAVPYGLPATMTRWIQ